MRTAWSAAISLPETRERMSAAAAEAWKDPKKRRNRMRAAADPETSKKKSESMKITLAKPEVRARARKAHKGQWDDPQKREQMANTLKTTLSDPKVKRRVSKAIKGVWSSYTPEQRAARVEKMQSARNKVYSDGKKQAEIEETGADNQVIIAIMRAHPDWGYSQVRKAAQAAGLTDASLSDSSLRRLSNRAGVPRPEGWQKGRGRKSA
jgi:hypothetical protein